MSVPILEIESITAQYGKGAKARRVLAPTDLGIARGESVAVVGRSGAGKSTLADVVLGLRTPASGRIMVCGEEWCTALGHSRKRPRHLVQGVPQDPGSAFVPRWTLRHSIERAVRKLTGERDVEERIRRAADLAQLDLDLLDRRLTEVSGGQAQRAAITRALAAGPAVLVADEPTSALDSVTAQEVSQALLGIARQSEIALMLVTHDTTLAERCDRTIRILPPPERKTKA